jgi:hypothetical protein
MAELTNVITGELDLDQSPKFLSKGDYSDARNIITGTSVSSDKIRLEKIIGTVALSESLGYTINKVIGKCVDEASGSVYFLATTSIATANKIIKKDSSNVFSTIVSYDFGWTDDLILNSVFFIQNSIIWIDNSDEIKRFPLDTYPVTPTAGALAPTEIGLMKKPPLVQPQIFGTSVTDIREQDQTTRDADYQFSVYFEYIDGGMSVISPISKVLPRNTWNPSLVSAGFEYRDIKVYFDINTTDVVGGVTVPTRRDTQYDDIPKSVKSIVFCGKRIRSTSWYEVGRINRVNDATYDLNLGKFETNYVKFNSTLSGNVIPSTHIGTQFFVPSNPSAISVANNKVFAFNFSEGKAAPEATGVVSARGELARDITTPVGTRGDILKMDYYSIAWDAVNNEYVKTKQTEATYTKYAFFDSENGFYDTDFAPLTYVPGDIVTIGASIDLSGTGDQQKVTPYFRYEADPGGGAKSAVLNLTAHTWPSGEEIGTAGPGTTRSMAFSSDSEYRVGYFFCGDFGRKSDVVSKENFVVRFGADKLWSSGIDYQINIEAEDIPSWATSLEVVRSKNTEKSKFIAGRASHTAYKHVDGDGVEYYDENWAADNLGLGISIEGLVRQGYGYEFNEGDRLKLFNLEEGVGDTPKGDPIIDEAIIGVDGYYVLITGDDFTGDSIINQWQDYEIEIYTPTDGDLDSVMYGNGQTHILTPGVRNTVSGILSGDLFIDLRKKYDPVDLGTSAGVKRSTDTTSWIFESTMTLDDDQVWVSPVGKAFLTTEFGEVLKENYARWGANIVNDTKINGLGDFLALDEAQTPVEHGAINAVALVGDTQSAGTVILALTATKPISLYIGATTLTNSDGTNTPIKSTDEVGLVRPQESDYGTINPESVFSRDGRVYYYDAVNRCFCMYSSNGVNEISKEKVSTFFRDIPLTTSKVITGYYNEYEMIMITVKDGFGAVTETIGYDVRQGKWRSFYDIFPDTYVSANDVMYTVKSGVFYESKKTPGGPNLRSHFHGSQFDSTIDVVFNDEITETKTWDLIKFVPSAPSIEWNAGDQRLVDVNTTITFSNEDGQESVSGIADMVIEDGTVFASVLLDANSTGGYLSGDEVRSKELVVKFTFKTSDNIQLGIVRAVYTPS